MSQQFTQSTDNFPNYYNLSMSGHEHQQGTDHAMLLQGIPLQLLCGKADQALRQTTLGSSPPSQEFSGLDWWFSAEHNKGPESHNVEQLVTYLPVLTPSCGA